MPESSKEKHLQNEKNEYGDADFYDFIAFLNRSPREDFKTIFSFLFELMDLEIFSNVILAISKPPFLAGICHIAKLPARHSPTIDSSYDR